MTLTFGPLALPAQLLVIFAAILLGVAVGNKIAAARGVKAEPTFWLVVAGAVLAARAAFVARYWSLYAQEPWRLPDLRDGGMDPLAGVVAVIALGGWLAWRRLAQRKAVASAVGAGLLIWAAGTGLVRMATERQPLPEVTLVDLDGRAVPLATFAGKPMVVNLWASWCPPCRREMPALGNAQQESADLTFVFVNQGEDAASVQAYLKAEDLSLHNVVRDPQGVLAKVAGAPGLPTTLFFDASGRLVDQRMGEVSRATLAAHLAALRGKP